ncbi:type II secretion system minor pseudopilin GspK [Vibrio sp. B1FLJ16]|uniref:type II secretion system minor pseudopilin GspK n=1 Tax=Vibrio sp. B1FLJ16 TaxID=2751178 RepID=UPI0015F550A0|nr:type II secretion system minor pseudopilin GspK [Vibrio sp. B1FLJ16]CAD7797130.1 COG3156 Type II secretory pathway [Vibrio sp. B1FLJ16]CAE6880071.1 COG3156 Type II secretory pathway [Vibrio sp. B1FLJ16]
MAKRQRGVALLIVLMLLAIMTTVAASMSERLFVQFKRGGNQLHYQQAYWYSIGVEALAKVAIEQSYKDSDTINMSQPWAIRDQVYPLDYGQATGHIRDKQACFNLNVLSAVQPTGQQTTRPYLVQVLQRLLEESEVEPYQAEVIADSAWEYIDSDSDVRSTTGVEDSTYESMTPAYLAANSWMADKTELRSVYQVSGDIYQKLAPLVCALPSDDWRLNVNTIEAEQAPILVAMFSPGLSNSDAVQLIEKRPFDGWNNVEAFLAESELAGLNENMTKEAKSYLGVDSAFFELDAQVLVDESRVRIRSLLQSTNRDTVTVVRRRFGGISERVSDRSAE